MFSTNEIRQKYLKFFKGKEHKVIDSSSLIPEDDQTTLFTSSGMQSLIPYLMGKKHPLGVRLTNSQKCFRAGDIEEVGDGRHTTFFEMLGNWSLGDYFKKEQLSWIFEFLVDEIRLDPNRLYVSVFKGNEQMGIKKDDEAVEIWQELFKKRGIKAVAKDMTEQKEIKNARIFFYGEKKNWWSRSGIPENMPIGEIGGPDSEIFYDFGIELGLHKKSQWVDEPCHINCDCGRFIEIGNSVFIEYIKTQNGFEKLKQRNVDFGGGLERIAMAAQNKSNIFEIDILFPASREIEELSGKSFSQNKKSFEILIDHLRASLFILGDKNGSLAVPSNTGSGYLVRRLIRRLLRSAKSLEIKTNDLLKIALILINSYKKAYPELEKNSQFVLIELEKEIKKFDQALKKGLQEFEKIIEKKDKLDGKETFSLYQTYGFPIEMIQEIATERGIKLDLVGFKEEKKKHSDLSKEGGDKNLFKGGLGDDEKETIELHTAAHLLLAALRKILGENVGQKGSNITAERLRFDFNYERKLIDEEKDKIEKLINFWIKKGAQVECQEMDIEKAQKIGAVGAFISKYDKRVNVYTIIKDDGEVISREICGGPHVENILTLGIFKIKKEESSSAGIRRIKAILIKNPKDF